ncbi:MAG: PKD domain-containing protein, partial [Ginsengibacter sp.]
MSGEKPWLCKWLICLCIILQGFNSKAQLSTHFSSTSTAGCSPLLIQFSDASSGSPTKYKWDLGNGTKSLLKNPAVTYFEPGQYTVKLVISNASGSDSITRFQYITVYSSPIPNFGSTITSGCFPLPVHFSDSTAAGSSLIAKWEWDFGDGNFDSVQNPAHIYRDGGSYNVSLRVTNIYGCIQSITKPGYVTIANGVRAAFNNDVPNSCKAPVDIHFVNKSQGSGVLSYTWDFGDGTTSTEKNPVHQYNKGGSYNLRLIVKNNTGCTDTLIKPNAITLGNINASFNLPDKICAGASAVITNSSTPLPGSVIWYFSDGDTASLLNTSKTFAKAGLYKIKMVANFGACLDSLEKNIEVLDKPLANFLADNTTDCKAPLPVSFKNTSINGVSYLWNFGDGQTSVEKDPVHTYVKKGSYNVSLTVNNAAGCTAVINQDEFVKIIPPSISILDLPMKGCAPLTQNFKSDIVSTEPVVSYNWSFGDGKMSTEAEPKHIFVNPGSYDITLIVKTVSGCTDTIVFVGGVIAAAKPKTDFISLQNDVCASMAVEFKDRSIGTVDLWSWSFGDGTTSAEKNPQHLYQDTGRFDLTLISLNNGCPDTLVKKDFIHIKGPIAKFTVAYKCADAFSRTFTNRSIAAETSAWDFGDGQTSSELSPVHAFDKPGIYPVRLTVFNSQTNCSYSITRLVSVIVEKAMFVASDTLICKGSAITFNTVDVNNATILSYNWNFGDGTKINGGASIQYIYKKSGTYSVTLIITNLLGCRDTLVKTNYIRVDGPTADVRSGASGTCLNSEIAFLDNSYSDGVHPISTWDFDYGDGNSFQYTAAPFAHSYMLPGQYNVVLKVTDSKGCTDTIGLPKPLIISHPLASFTAKDSISCPGKSITFINDSEGPGLTYLWNFGDSATSTEAKPVHNYTTAGLYNVTLSVKDRYGCTDMIVKTDFINIVMPKADFVMSDSVTNCPPLVVNFTNTSTNATTTSWDFGDGNTSNLRQPSHFYAFAGQYKVKLSITTPGGCTDEKIKTIIINGPEGTLTYTNNTGCSPLLTNFKATAKNNASFIWDFNDGNTLVTKDSVLKHVYDEPGTYLPKIILVDGKGCQVPIVGSDTITVFDVAADFSLSDNLLCDSGSVKFLDNSSGNDPITSYLWNFGDGKTSNLQNPAHTYLKEGAYLTSLIVTTQAGCRDTLKSSAEIKIVNSPKIGIEAIDGACVPAPITFSGKLLKADTSALNWQWNFANGASSNLQNPAAQTYAVANNYNVKLTATNSSGCSTTVIKIATAYPLPNVKVNDNLYICKGQSVTLTATGAQTYSWLPDASLSCLNCATPTIKPATDIQYKVTGKSGFGCIASDSVVVSVKQPFLMQVSQNDSICSGSRVKLSASGTDKFTWSPSTGLNNAESANPVATPAATTTYTVIGTDDRGCFKDTAFVSIKVNPMPTVDA